MSPSWACPVNRAHIKRPLDGQLWNRHSVSVSERSPSYKESNKGSKEKQGPTLGIRFTEVSVL